MPEVSVVIPTYNVEKFILETVNSVLVQSFTSFEILIVDDCSTDSTATKLVENFSDDNRVRLFLNKENLGSGHCRNIGIENSKGRYIAFLDADDVWDVSKLSCQVEYMKKNDSAISHTAYTFIDSVGNKLPGRSRVSKTLSLLDNLKRTEIGTSTAMIDTKIVGREFRFCNIRARQDLVLWSALMSSGFVSSGLDSELVKYRVREGSVSSNKFRMLWVTLKVYMGFKQISVLKRIYCYCSYVLNAIRKRV